MKKKQSTVKLERDYEKVFLNTLDWCPLFGYLPSISNSSIVKHPIIIYYNESSPTEGFTTADVSNKCLDIIKEARSKYWDIMHHDLVEYDSHPIVQKLPTKKDSKGHECEYAKYGQKIHRSRILFQSVYKLAWGSWPVDDHHSSTLRTTPPMYNVLTTNKPELLLSDAICYLGTDLGATYLDEIYSIFMIHEAWCLLHGMLLNKYKPSDKQLIHNSLDYIDELHKNADVFKEKRQSANYKQQEELKKTKRLQDNSTGGKVPKAAGFQEAIKQAIKIKDTTKARTLWTYFKNNHKGENNNESPDHWKNTMKYKEYLIYYLPDEDGNDPDGFLYQFNTETKDIRRNKFSAFEKNLQEVLKLKKDQK